MIQFYNLAEQISKDCIYGELINTDSYKDNVFSYDSAELQKNIEQNTDKFMDLLKEAIQKFTTE